MKKFFFVLVALATLSGCVNKHPYNYVINVGISEVNKSAPIWHIAEIENNTSLAMSTSKKTDLTNRLHKYLLQKSLKVVISPETCNDCLLVKSKIIETMAEMSQNEAGWHGTSEDPLDFWSHFSPGGPLMQSVNGHAPALSLYVEVFAGDKKYFENAGGIELVGKYNKFTFRTINKEEFVSDSKRFDEAMEIAFGPLLTALNKEK